MATHPWTICTFEPWKSNPKPSWSTPSAHPQRPKLITRVDAISTAGFRELLQSGTVRSVAPNDAASTLRNEGFLLLDVRPVWEREKARVEGSLHVPLFVEDKDMGPITLLKKWVHFGYIGLWTGQYFTTINEHFLSQVEALAPDKGAKLLVACGEGLRYCKFSFLVH